MPSVDSEEPSGGTALGEQVGDCSAILLEIPGANGHEDEACVELMAVDDHSSVEVIGVNLDASPDDVVDRWRRQDGSFRPAAARFVTTDQYARSAAGTSSPIRTPDDSIRIDTVSSPGNLTQVGVAITEQLEAHRQSESERPVVVCMQSLGTLLQYTDTRTVFCFLHTLSGQLEKAGAVAHYHLDSTGHDETTVNAIRALFDVVVSYEEREGWTVRTRSR